MHLGSVLRRLMQGRSVTVIIEKIHIDNFGKLKNLTLDLSSGFNLIFGNNEDGKTTIMSFIRLMFYGSGTQKNDINCNLRRRFTPFDKSKMGGYIEFIHDKKPYMVAKTFGKTPKSDTVSLFDRALGKEIPLAAGQEVGELFFSMGAGAFERSIYIGSLPLYSDDGAAELSKKLSSVATSGDTGDGYDSVKKRLQSAKNELRTPRKVGLSDRLESEINTLKADRTDALGIEQHRLLLEKQIATLENDIAALAKKRDLLKTQAEQSRAAAALNSLKSEKSARQEYLSLKTELGDFNERSAARAGELLRQIDILDALLKEKSALIPQDDTADTADIDIQLQEAFRKYEPLFKQHEALTAQIKENEQKLACVQEQGGKNPAFMFVAAILFALSAVAGCFASPAFLALLAPAVVFLIIGFTESKKTKTAKRKKEAQKEELLKLRSDELDLRERCRSAESLYGMIKQKKELLLSSNEQKMSSTARLKEEINQTTLKLTDLKSEAAEVLGTDCDLKCAFAEKQALLNRLMTQRHMLDMSEHRQLSDSEIDLRLASYVPPSDGKTAEEYEKEAEAVQKAITDRAVEAERLKSEAQTLFKNRRGIAALDRLIDEKLQELALQNEHFTALNIAEEVLAEAYSEMRQTFAPELNRLTGELFCRLTGGRYQNAIISDDLSVKISAQGESVPFDCDHLSAGSRDQLELCLRLALAKLTCGDNRLPLLLDDILIQYDANRAAMATEFISEYSKENQVLFFTCHDHITKLSESAGANIIKL